MLKQTIANQQSEAVCILAQGDLIGNDPPEILLGHTMAVEDDRTDCSDCGRKKKEYVLNITGRGVPKLYSLSHTFSFPVIKEGRRKGSQFI